MSRQICLKYFLPLALGALPCGLGQELWGDSGPPEGSDPLSWGFYATPEVQQPAELPIEGSIPDWITGSLYRGAYGTWDVGNYTGEHWLDGFSRTHRFEIRNGAISYRSRNGSDEVLDFVRETGMFPNGAFGADPCKIIFGALETTYRDGVDPVGSVSSSNVNVAYIPNFPALARNSSNTGNPFESLVVTTDAHRLQQIDPVTLEPIELFTYQASNPAFSGGRVAAHVASVDGYLYNYLLDVSVETPGYAVFELSPSGESRILANITDAPPAYIHSVFSTSNYIIMSIWQADITLPGRTILSSLGPWDPERKTLFYVIDRQNGGIIAKYVADIAFFAFHEINSYEEENGDIIVDMPTMVDYRFLNAATMANLRANLGSKTNASSAQDIAGSPTRFRLPFCNGPARHENGTLIARKAETVVMLPYDQANIELPRINDAYKGRYYKYAYGVHTQEVGYFSDSIIKVDLESQEWKVWSPPTKQLPCEPIFVAAPDAVAEDDGVLLTVAMDSAVQRSSLVVINATTMEEIGRGRMPIVMGYGLHGAWGNSIA